MFRLLMFSLAPLSSFISCTLFFLSFAFQLAPLDSAHLPEMSLGAYIKMFLIVTKTSDFVRL